MALMQTICIHDVTSIKIDPPKEHVTDKDCYATRTITIHTAGQRIELTCFSEHGTMDDDAELMRLIV